jgi:hypothetical protein
MLLFRPVGKAEMDLIEKNSGMSSIFNRTHTL